MIIGIDLRALQTGHKFRGIGEVTKQVVNRIIRDADATDSFIFYEYDDDTPRDLLTMPTDLPFEVVKLGRIPENPENVFSKKEKVIRRFKQLFGDPIADSAKSDVFLQFDYAFGVPSNTKSVVIVHDFIPYVFWDKFFESPFVSLRRRALRTALRTWFNNFAYLRTLKRSLHSAHSILAISESTKHDAEQLLNVPSSKVRVVHNGVSHEPSKTTGVQRPDMPTKPYLLFIGAADARRRVDDLVAAYNNLKADGHDIQLALVGENFIQKDWIPNPLVRHEVLSSSYQNDILTMGYVDDETKQKLYENAIAFVYPTLYEGFGIPILESMLHNSPIISYRNSSTYEIGGSYALYAHDWSEIVSLTKELIDEPAADRAQRVAAAKKHAESFTWDKTATGVQKELRRVGML
jgi:glycosyltransferase involved in cell wall biosynthesis